MAQKPTTLDIINVMKGPHRCGVVCAFNLQQEGRQFTASITGLSV